MVVAAKLGVGYCSQRAEECLFAMMDLLLWTFVID